MITLQGHSTTGWIVGLVLSELWPDRKTEILLRAREFAESRVVCGVHSLGATQAGEALGRVIYERIQKSSAYHRDVELARKEISREAADAGKPDSAACTEQRAALAAPLLPK